MQFLYVTDILYFNPYKPENGDKFDSGSTFAQANPCELKQISGHKKGPLKSKYFLETKKTN